MKINAFGLNLIKQYEGLRLQPYLCSANHLTIGYGHVILPNEKFESITEVQANLILANDIGKFEKQVSELIKVQINDNQFSAIIALAFNIGVGNFKSSTMLKLINQNGLILAGCEFAKWVYVNKNPTLGLARRRAAEMNLYYL